MTAIVGWLTPVLFSVPSFESVVKIKIIGCYPAVGKKEVSASTRLSNYLLENYTKKPSFFYGFEEVIEI
jgi:hypothetical protein